MIEIALGSLLVAAAVMILMGAGDMLFPAPDLFPLLGFGGTAAIAGLGLILIVRGLFRLLRHRRGANYHWLRTTGLMWAALLLLIAFGIVIPALVQALNLVTIGGFPLGYYMAAQGCLIALVALAFVFAAKQERIDAEAGVVEDAADGC
jgi:putative solute:sodium symporter small subunit